MLPSKHSSHVLTRPCTFSRPNIRLQWLRSTQLHPNRGPCSTSHAATAKATPDQQVLLQQVMNYQYEVEMPEGRLVISVLRPEWLQRAADLLTDCFLDTKGIQPYRRYVRRNISSYLEQHSKMPPAAVVLTAILQSKVVISPELDAMMQDTSSSSSSNDTSPATMEELAAALRPAAEAATGSLQMSTSSSTQQDVHDSKGGPGWAWWQQQQRQLTPASSSNSSSSSSSSSGVFGSSSSNSGGGGGLIDANPPDTGSSRATSGSSSGFAMQFSPGSGTVDTSSKQQQNVGSLLRSALRQLMPQILQQQQQQQQQQEQQYCVVETLVGVTEVSFHEKTRSLSMTLNPPSVCAYLCNMAVSSQWQRRGVASRLISAVEDLCVLAAEREVYLHLRFKDKDTAGGLYSKAGFSAAAADWPMLTLLGQQPRYLMKKVLPADRPLVGSLRLPDAAPGIAASAAAVLPEETLQVLDAPGQVKQPAAAAAPAS